MELFASLIRQWQPDVSPDKAKVVARLWARHRDRIVDRIHELTRESGRVAWHVDAREEAIGHMARLLAFLTDRMLEHLTKNRSVNEIDAFQEEEALSQPDALERVENTAQNVAPIWFRIYDDLARKYPLISVTEREWPPRLPAATDRQRQPGTTRNHYVPVFSTKPWADENGKVRVIKRTRGGAVTAKLAGYRSFGYERFLYGQRLENWFSQVEQRAQQPYAKLLATDPLTADDRYFWITFLAVQHLRTPSSMARMAQTLRQHAKLQGWPWSMHASMLRSAHVSLFQDDKVFASYYRTFKSRRWTVLIAATGHAFPRTDFPIVASLTRNGLWCCYYALTPERCFVAGPHRAERGDVPAALTEQLSTDRTARLVELFVSSSRKSFVTRPADDERAWLAMARHVPVVDPIGDYRAWGELDIL